MSTIVFSHANSFPASTHRVLFKDQRSRGVVLIDSPILGG